MIKKLLLVIDIQQEYIAEGRPFHIKGISSSLNNAKALIAKARQSNIPVWHVQHFRDSGDIFSKENKFSDFIDGYEPSENEKHFIKNKYSCFSSQAFTDALNQEKPDEIIVAGYGSSMCCLCTIIEGIHRGYRFTLVDDATAARGFDHADEDVMHSSAINILKQYANCVKTKSVLFD